MKANYLFDFLLKEHQFGIDYKDFVSLQQMKCYAPKKNIKNSQSAR